MKTILLDPGHGWSNTAGRYGRPLVTIENDKVLIVPNSMHKHEKDYAPGYYREDFGTVKIASYAKNFLEKQGLNVFITRSLTNNLDAAAHLSSEFGANLWQKTTWKAWRWIHEATVRYKADLLVSIHTNAGGGTGTTAFYSSGPGKALATILCAEVSANTGINNRGARQKNYTVIKNVCGGNTCLLECAFHDTFEDLRLLLSSEGLEIIGKAISLGISNFLGGLSK